jgi:K+-transporting ATPase KdpF subunit
LEPYSSPGAGPLSKPATGCKKINQKSEGRNGAVLSLFHSDFSLLISRGDSMDYIIAGIAALFIFAYLVYALLRPEKF